MTLEPSPTLPSSTDADGSFAEVFDTARTHGTLGGDRCRAYVRNEGARQGDHKGDRICAETPAPVAEISAVPGVLEARVTLMLPPSFVTRLRR